VLVRGTATGRRWLRSRHTEDEPISRALEQGTPLLNPALPAELSAAERHALLALRRATSEATLESQLEALWEAIEFYAAGTKTPHVWGTPQAMLDNNGYGDLPCKSPFPG